jgi:putative nucleotidyltransferase with HDIG domain
MTEGPALRRLVPGDSAWRWIVLALVAVACALTVIELRSPTDGPLRVGDVATRTVKAPFTFTFADRSAHERAREEARELAPPVYVQRTDLLDERHERIRRAFGAGRDRAAALGTGKLGAELSLVVVQAFLEPLGVQLPEEEVLALAATGFRPEVEEVAHTLLDRAMRDERVVLARDQLPADRRPIVVIRLVPGGVRDEEVVADLDGILVPETARQRVSLGLLEAKVESGADVDAAAGVARALVTPNLAFDPLQTEERREAAANAVELGLETVKRGQILLTAGQVVGEPELALYEALQQHQGERNLPMQVGALSLFLALLLTVLYQFGTMTTRTSASVRDVAAAGALLWLVALVARIVVAASEGVAAAVGYEAEASSVWFLVPVGGAVILVRLLLGLPWTLPFAVAAGTVCGLVMDLQALPVVFFLVSALAAAASVDHTRERIAVVRAGAAVGLVNAVAVLLIHFVQLFFSETELSLATTMRPFWSMAFAFGGGLASGFAVLGLVPVFETFGFVTDYRLMELANLNHPLLRQLMLRAPGSYHHSVIVGTLAEAGAEAIGANALVAKVASYFHDIGKALKPAYFVENQNGVNRHQELDPYVSAAIIVAHVTEGGRMAREHGLPQPIVDNIYMHHGTGLLQFFYAEAQRLSADPDSVDPTVFRYPGPKPSTREAGIIMLADKVEAATRTLRTPDEGNIRAMIAHIVNSVVADGQFTECPLTMQEVHTIAETFVRVLVAINHQRIEYPQTRALSRAPRSEAPSATTGSLTLELPLASLGGTPQSSQRPTPTPAPVRPLRDGALEDGDYEAVEYLPSGTTSTTPPRRRP